MWLARNWPRLWTLLSFRVTWSFFVRFTSGREIRCPQYEHIFHIFSQMRAQKQLNLTQVIGLISTKIYCYFRVRLSILVYKESHQNLNDIQIFFFWHLLFSSPERKAQLSFSDQNLSIVCRCRCFRCPCCKLFTFSSSSPEPLSQFQPNLAQSILGWRGFKLVQMKGPALFQGEIITK